MFHLFTDFPYASNQQCGLENEWYTKHNVLTNAHIYHNSNFQNTISSLYPNQKLSLLEIGCGAGNIVEDFIIDNHLAVGVDGFYVYKKYNVGAWGRIPYNLFTCDIGCDFTIGYDEYARFDINNIYKFDIVYTTEFFEHLYINQIEVAIRTVAKHLKNGGLFIAEISYKEQGGHVTIKNRQEWIDLIALYGLVYNQELTDIFSNKYLRNLPSSHQFVFIKN